MQVMINGKTEEIAENMTILKLLAHYGLQPEITIVEKNQIILKPEAYAEEPVQAGDCLELIRYMGGG